MEALFFVILAILFVVIIGGAMLWLMTMALPVFVIGGLVLAGIGVVFGLLLGLCVPFWALLSSRSKPQFLASPQAVRAGKVFHKEPSGPARNFGWDPAWPLYFPYQLRKDRAAVYAETNLIVKKVWFRWALGFLWRPHVRGNGLIKGFFAFIWKCLFFWVTAVPGTVTAGFVWIGAMIWQAVTYVVEAVALPIQLLILWIARKIVTLRARAQRRTIRCPRCYETFEIPRFKCPTCFALHSDLRPGPQGIVNRLCECGTILPVGSKRAAKKLEAYCPYCTINPIVTTEIPLPLGSGNRRVVMLPVFGAIGSGKTRFLASLLVSLELYAQNKPDMEFAALNRAGMEFLQVANLQYQQNQQTFKTQRDDYPEGLQYNLRSRSDDLELQLIDAAGESFTGPDSTSTLRYWDTSEVLILLLDPLALPEVAEKIRLVRGTPSVQIAQGSADIAYASVLDRLRSSNLELKDRRFALVVTKTDVLNQTLPHDAIPFDDQGVRAWLMNNGADGLVRNVEMDFNSVNYFAIASRGGGAAEADDNPVRVADWAIQVHGGAAILPLKSPVRATTPLPPAQ